VDSTATHLPRESDTAVKGDAWILQPTQPSRDSEMINELLSLGTRGFDSPRESETAVTGDARIRQARQPPRESEIAVTGDAWI
jgi:hypothetical protein